ncbi:oxidoreductase [Bacillus carboniphilus]|uniref:Oxidoreductase n=2 Tax=Bacillati TaxID=1783272 RepID=A0ABP3G549_9BACI
MVNRVAVVTGASSGFGMQTSIELAKEGFHVLATMRNVQKKDTLIKRVEELGIKERVETYELDVTSEASIIKWKRFMEEKQGRIDVLVNNAGYAGAGFSEEVSVEEYKAQFETNVFGVMAVTQAILPLMRRQMSGKIINVSSISGRVGFPGLSPYIASKHALEGYSESLRLELKPFGVDVVLIEPGSYQTNIWTTGKKVAEKSLEKDSPYYETMKKMEHYLERSSGNYGDPQEVAKLIVKLAKQDKVGLRYPVGKGVKRTIRLKQWLPWRIWENILLKQLK